MRAQGGAGKRSSRENKTCKRFGVAKVTAKQGATKAQIKNKCRLMLSYLSVFIIIQVKLFALQWALFSLLVITERMFFSQLGVACLGPKDLIKREKKRAHTAAGYHFRSGLFSHWTLCRKQCGYSLSNFLGLRTMTNSR